MIFEDLKIQGVLPGDIALIIVSGDLTWQANPHEFSNVFDFFDKLKNYFGLSNKHVIIVPGNHDIEWLDEKGNIDSNAELNYFNFYQRFYNVLPEKTFMRIGKFDINGKILCVVGLNSCRLESMENAGFGYIGDEQLRKVQEYLDLNEDINTICVVCHHHLLPVNYIEEISVNDKKVSMMLDAGLVIRTLLASKTNIVLHGHQHQPYYSQIRRIIPDYIDKKGKKSKLDAKLSIVGGGSCGVKQSEINVIGRNTYNLLYFDNSGKQLSIITRVKSGNGLGFYDEGEIKLEL